MLVKPLAHPLQFPLSTQRDLGMGLKEKKRKGNREGRVWGFMLTVTIHINAPRLHAHTRTRRCFPIFLLRLHLNLRLAGPVPSYFPKNCKAARRGELLGMMTAGGKAC